MLRHLLLLMRLLSAAKHSLHDFRKSSAGSGSQRDASQIDSVLGQGVKAEVAANAGRLGGWVGYLAAGRSFQTSVPSDAAAERCVLKKYIIYHAVIRLSPPRIPVALGLPTRVGKRWTVQSSVSIPKPHDTGDTHGQR